MNAKSVTELMYDIESNAVMESEKYIKFINGSTHAVGVENVLCTWKLKS